jgi:hypothetical protein
MGQVRPAVSCHADDARTEGPPGAQEASPPTLVPTGSPLCGMRMDCAASSMALPKPYTARAACCAACVLLASVTHAKPSSSVCTSPPAHARTHACMGIVTVLFLGRIALQPPGGPAAGVGGARVSVPWAWGPSGSRERAPWARERQPWIFSRLCGPGLSPNEAILTEGQRRRPVNGHSWRGTGHRAHLDWEGREQELLAKESWGAAPTELREVMQEATARQRHHPPPRQDPPATT